MRFPLKQTLKISSYIRKQKGCGKIRFPLVLMLEPLFACNFSCSGCGRIKEYKDSMKDELSLQSALKAVDDANAPVVSICGGEPLLYTKLNELLEGTLKRGKVTYLCTNGWLLSKKIDDMKPHPLLNINVHIDGLANTHDLIVERKGAFDRAIDGVIAAKKKGFTVCTNTTVYVETDVREVIALVDLLEDIGIDGILISPGFDYEDVQNRDLFLKRERITEKFRNLNAIRKSKKLWTTPLFFDYLEGKRDFNCTPWGNVTYNPKGWKSPCYLITDKHFENFTDFIDDTQWSSYGKGSDQRCNNCMAHCGIEPTVALQAASSFKDGLRMAMWMLF